MGDRNDNPIGDDEDTDGGFFITNAAYEKMRDELKRLRDLEPLLKDVKTTSMAMREILEQATNDDDEIDALKAENAKLKKVFEAAKRFLLWGQVCECERAKDRGCSWCKAAMDVEDAIKEYEGEK